jgi:peptidyl-prolyl cis-trans isomerase D
MAMSIQDQIKKSLDQHSINGRSLMAYTLFGAIILVFVLFGFPGKQGMMGQGIVAEVNGAIISGAELKEETSQLERFYAQMFGGNFGMQAQRQMLESQAMENLITRELLAQEATKAGVYVSDKEVREFIIDIPAFQEQGRFDKARYFQYLEGTRSTAGEFESKIRKEAQRMRVKRLFDLADAGSSLQLSKDAELSALKLNVQFAKVDREALIKSVVVGPAAAQEFLKNPENLKKVEVDYESHKNDLYSTPEQVKAEHILIKAKDGDAEAEKKALTKIMDIKTRAAKEDFSTLAKAHSEDEGSKVKGGDLGYFGRGQMVPPFESAAFSAKVGDLVGPVKTSFGYHLIRVNDKKAAQVRTLEDAKHEIASKLIAETQLDEKFQKIEGALAKKNVEEVEAQLKDWKVSWEETGEFDLQTESIPKLAGGESLKEAVWSLGQSGQWLDHLVRDGSHRYIFKMKEIKKVDAKPLDTKAAQAGTGALFEGWLESIREGNQVIRRANVAQESDL